MVLRLVNASEVRTGNSILVDGAPYIVRTNDISKTGKHGHAKCRIEAISILDGKKKVFAVNGHERFEVPMIIKKRAQVLSLAGDKADVMDLESYETLEMTVPEELKEGLKGEDQVEYWDVEGSKIIKKKV